MLAASTIRRARRFALILVNGVCMPELNISTRQYGWSGEQAVGFLKRLTNDVLRFHPNVVTTCYGMNDHHYQPYTDEIGNTYRTNQEGIVAGCKAANVRTIIVGSPGCMGQKAAWGFIKGTAEERNLNLCNLRNIDVDIAKKEGLAPGLGSVPGGVSLHLACHARAQNMGAKAAEMLRLLPEANLDVIERCSGHGGSWGVKKENFSTAMKVGRPAARQIAPGRRSAA